MHTASVLASHAGLNLAGAQKMTKNKDPRDDAF